METSNLTPAERVFRAWMLICAVMFGFAMPFFFFGGVWIVRVINAISPSFLPAYPVPASGFEGAFWRVLGVSMMAMLTWVCCCIYQDVRGRGYLVTVILISKFCSTALYGILFVSDHRLAYLVGALTDGPIFVITLVLWYVASCGDRYLDSKEEAILTALGAAFVPRGGPFALGYPDLEEQSLAGSRQLLAALDPLAQAGARLILRAINWAPLVIGFRCRTLLKMQIEERPLFLMRLEGNRSSTIRMMTVATKALALFPFFNQPAAAEAVGYDPDARARL